MNRSDTVKTLELVSRALADTNMIPMYQCLCFSGKRVSAYNDSLGIFAPLKSDVFAVNGPTLLGLLKNSHTEDVELSLDQENLLVKAGRSTFKLPYFEEKDFLLEEPKDKADVKYQLGKELLEGLSACLMTSSKDNTQPALMGVWLKQENKHTVLYSCNGDAVTRFTTAAPAVKAKDYMMPNSFCEAVLKIAEETEAKTGALWFNKDWAVAELPSKYTIYGRLIENDTPLDHAALIKKNLRGTPTYIPIPKGLDNALSRARVVADAESAKTLLTLEAGRMRLVTETHMGVVRDTLAAKGHPDVQAKVSAELMQHTIALCDEMAVFEGCIVYRNGDKLLQLLSNMG